MNAASADLLAREFPGVSLAREISGRETLLAIGHARELLGYDPAVTWQSPPPA
jgi:hypothetical protein